MRLLDFVRYTSLVRSHLFPCHFVGELPTTIFSVPTCLPTCLPTVLRTFGARVTVPYPVTSRLKSERFEAKGAARDQGLPLPPSFRKRPRTCGLVSLLKIKQSRIRPALSRAQPPGADSPMPKHSGLSETSSRAGHPLRRRLDCATNWSEKECRRAGRGFTTRSQGPSSFRFTDQISCRCPLACLGSSSTAYRVRP